MNPTILKEYSSDKRFILYEAAPYTPLFGEAVVFRAMGGMLAGPSMDLIFLGVHYFELPNQLSGVRVWRPRDDEALQFGRSFAPDYSGELADRVYGVEVNGKRFHVIATGFWVHLHRELNRSSALTQLNDLDARDAYIQRYVKEWFKVE